MIRPVRSAVCAAALIVTAQAAWAQSPIKIGFISSMSGPEGVIGRDLSDGFKLAITQGGNKMGGRPVEIVWGDDAYPPSPK